jgi:Spy/CpxP family protein refolding chaperone
LIAGGGCDAPEERDEAPAAAASDSRGTEEAAAEEQPLDPRLDLLRGIELTAAQKARIDSIQSRHDSVRAAVQSSSTSSAETVMRMMPHMQQQRTAIRSVLTPPQQAVYDSNVTELREWMRKEASH